MTDGSRRSASTSRPMRGQAGTMTSWPRCSKRAFQPSQLRVVSQRPWMRTMGVFMLDSFGSDGHAKCGGVEDGMDDRTSATVAPAPGLAPPYGSLVRAPVACGTRLVAACHDPAADVFSSP